MSFRTNGFHILSIVLICLPLLGFSQTNFEQIQVIPGELPDPSVIEVDGVYYATGTTGDWAPVYPIYKSTDLYHWEHIGAVFDTNPDWTMGSFWAPELFYENGTFYCYYTARGTDGISKIGVATTTDITQGFIDQGVLIDWGEEAIDAYVYREDKSLYITWKAYGLTPDKPIQILGSQLSDDGLKLIGEHFEIVTAEDDTWEKGGIEGQAIIKHGDFLYMLYSGNACCGKDCDYMVGVARSKSMEGPWKKYDQNPMLKGNSMWKCPGHGTAVQFNEDWFYLYHAYNTKGFPKLGRAALLSQMYWDENGWPYFKVEPSLVEGNRLEQNITEDFEGNELGRHWKFNVKNSPFNARVGNGTLTITETQPDSTNNTGAVLCVIPDDSEFEITTKVINKNSALKGIVLYTTKNHSLGLGTRGNHIILWKVEEGKYTELDSKAHLEKIDNVWLKAELKDNTGIRLSYSVDGQNWQRFDALDGNNLAWWSSGMKAGLQIKKDNKSGDDNGVFDFFSIEYN